MLESLLNKVAGLTAPIKKTKKGLQHRCFPMKLTKFLEHYFYRTSLVAASGNGKIFDCLSIFYYHNLAKSSV